VTYLPVIVLFYFEAPFLASHLLGNTSYAPLIRVLAFDVFLNAAVLPIQAATLLGLRMFRETAVVGLTIEGIIRQILIVSLILILRSFLGLVIGWLFSDAATVAIYMVLTVRALGRPRFDFPLGKLFRFYLPLELAQIVGFIQTWFDRTLLVIFVPLSTLGVYNVAVTAYGVVANVSGGIGGMLFPALSSIQENPNKGRLRDAIGLGTRYACLTVTPLDFILLATAIPALALFVGESYVGGSLPLMIFCAADALTLFATALNPALMAMGETAVICAIKAVTAMVGLTAAYLLLPTWGIVGASAGRALTVILTAILQGLIITRKVRLKFDVRSIAKTLVAGTTTAAFVTSVELVHYDKFMLPIYVIVGTILYLVLLRFLRSVDANDLELLRRYLGKRLSPIAKILGLILLVSPKKPT
jgi:O-antigen/teichoic acid export membrane protein